MYNSLIIQLLLVLKTGLTETTEVVRDIKRHHGPLLKDVAVL